MKLMYRLKGDTGRMYAWAFTETPEEAELLFRKRLAYDISRPATFRFESEDHKKDAARRVATRDFEVEIDPNYLPGTSVWGYRVILQSRTSAIKTM